MIQRRFFFKNLGFFLAPMLIPSVVLGSLLIYIAPENARETAERSSLNLLRQYRESVELIFASWIPSARPSITTMASPMN